MKKIIILPFILFTLSFLPADTHIPYGDVSGTWSIDGSPYIIDGHINVPVDSILVIEPGVNVIFSDQYYFRIYGKLLSEGTLIDTIYFTVQDTINDFAGLFFCEADTSFQDSSKMNFCKFDPGCVSFNNSSCAIVKNSIVTNGYGIGFDNSNPTIVDVTITNNTSEGYGGGLYCTNSSNPSLINVTISGNTAAGAGGIWCNDNSNPTLDNVYVENNSPNGFSCTSSSPILNNVTISGHEGGGFSCSSSSNPILNNVIISNNNSYGGIFCANSNPILSDVTINENSADIYGGGIYFLGNCNPILINVTITGNEAGGLGGGICSDFADIIIVNSLIVGNTAGGGGGIGCFYEGSSMNLTNVTISENISLNGFGGGIYSEFGSNIHLENCIMWNDIPNEVVILTGSFVSANYCDIEGGAMGTGNIDDDPLFSDDEFHLSEYSPCIDAGNPDSLYYDIEDSFNPGYALYPAMGTILNDMGAYGGHGYYGPPVSVDEELITEKPVIELNNYPNP
ncbi:MAG: right-handed parallel beta-helix repeat-containing protein, partial [Candidatus Cloacimonetes bacterium]|nr:right-handed parallel beta-helix repeat-containing protein [Candidatus Cloacimonadota bacterium]